MIKPYTIKQIAPSYLNMEPLLDLETLEIRTFPDSNILSAQIWHMWNDDLAHMYLPLGRTAPVCQIWVKSKP